MTAVLDIVILALAIIFACRGAVSFPVPTEQKNSPRRYCYSWSVIEALFCHWFFPHPLTAGG